VARTSADLPVAERRQAVGREEQQAKSKKRTCADHDFLHAVLRCGQQRYGCLQYTLPYKQTRKFIHWPRVDRLIGAVYAEGSGREDVYGETGARVRDAIAAGGRSGRSQDATIVLKNGRTARVTMHLIEGKQGRN